MKCTLLLLVVVLVSAEEYEEKPDAIEVIDLPPPHELMEQEVKPRHRACDCNINSVWIDMVFVIDTSRAVSQQDFIAVISAFEYFNYCSIIDILANHYNSPNFRIQGKYVLLDNMSMQKAEVQG
uniref:Peptidase S1 domain-containing protein n=1 Tax=Parascaris univalens TaxID=6257 RepID=A0A915AL95_PARUN